MMIASLMTTKTLLLLLNCLVIIELISHLMLIEVYGANNNNLRNDDHHDFIRRKMQAIKDSISSPPSSLISPSPTLAPSSSGTVGSTLVYHVSTYGADPTGKSDSTEALMKVLSDASKSISNGVLIDGISNLGGVQINLDGGIYLISRPLQFPTTNIGNIVMHGGTLLASDNFATDRYLIELSASPPSQISKENTTSSTDQNLSSSSYNFEYITFRDLMLDCNYKGGGIAVINTLRVSIDNCYIVHFMSEGIRVESGHETLIRSSYLGQHITAGNDPGERNFTGTAITLMGNDNVVNDVVIFSANTGIIVSGQANLLSGVHCYNKATGFGGTGIYLKLAGLTQTRIVNSYLDYTGIVAEDPVQLIISNNFFLGDAYIKFKSVKGVANGVNIVDNIFAGSGNGIDIVQLDGPFGDVDQILIDRNSVKGMNAKATIAKSAVQGNGSTYTADFNGILLFPNLIKHVQYTLSTSGNAFPNYALRNVSQNRVVIESSVAAPTSVYVMVDQGFGG
ncbi:polygalacturonase QRT3-like [Chenopodium quinoa]|uniref:polygalacturonase QRT3-like n=1 Tax=Chenopodium quinoa TaxID=63459 RepID=UPI000B76E9FE|nr:polygalacturonase QRT3-like [Chenopodium quinoa]